MEPSPLIPENLEELVADATRLQPLLVNLHAEATRLADKNALRACGKRLGVLTTQAGRKGLDFSGQLEVDAFQDYLLYIYRPHGFSLVKQLRNRRRAQEGTDEHLLLEGMSQARFSLFLIKEVYPAGAFLAWDVVLGQAFFVLDQSLPRHEDPVGLLIGLRLFPMKNAWMHTGVAMILGKVDDEKGEAPLGKCPSEKEERLMNEAIFTRWRSVLETTEAAL